MFEFVKSLMKHISLPECVLGTTIVNDKPIKYILNDPTTPSMVLEVLPPSPPNGMNFIVHGYKGGGYELNTIEGQAANNYVTITNSIKQNQAYCNKLKKWAGTTTLSVIPRAGKDFNAYYDRRNIKLFYVFNPVLKKMVYAADSTDIVSHELGHGILDSIRPDLYNVQVLEIWSFHEAFADINSVMSILGYKPIIEHILQETKNDLRRDNTVTRLAEEFSVVLYDSNKEGIRGGGLRNAINNFVYVRPEKLPPDGEDNVLSKDPHSFGRLFLGSWYEILVRLYEYHLSSLSPVDALIKSRDIAGEYLWGGILQAPACVRFFDSVAKGMISFSKMKNTPDYTNIIESVFKKRKILLSRITVLNNIELRDLKLKAGDVIIKGRNSQFFISNEIKRIKLNQHLGITIQSDNPLLDLEVDVPKGTSYEFDKRGFLRMQSSDSWEDTLDGVRACLLFLHDKKMVDGVYDKPNSKSTFEAKDGKLSRTRFF